MRLTLVLKRARHSMSDMWSSSNGSFVLGEEEEEENVDEVRNVLGELSIELHSHLLQVLGSV